MHGPESPWQYYQRRVNEWIAATDPTMIDVASTRVQQAWAWYRSWHFDLNMEFEHAF